MIVKDNNSNKIRIPCFSKFIKDNLVEVSTKLDVIIGETQTIETSISESIKNKWREDNGSTFFK